MRGFGSLAHHSSGMALEAAIAAPIRLALGTLSQHRFRSQRAAHSLEVAVVVAIITIGDAHYHEFALSCTRCSHDEDCSHVAR